MRTVKILGSGRDKRVALALVVGALAVLVTGAVLVGQFRWLTDPFTLRETVRGYGPLAPLVFVALQAAQVVVAPIPGQALGLVSGFLFGTVWGTAYSLVGATIGSFVVFTLARRLGRPYVERAVAAETLAEFDRVTDEEGVLTLFLIFLVPGLPDDVVCFLAGLTDISIPKLVAISFVGRIPGYLVVNATGAGLASDRLVEATAALLVLTALSVLAYRHRGWLFERLVGPA